VSQWQARLPRTSTVVYARILNSLVIESGMPCCMAMVSCIWIMTCTQVGAQEGPGLKTQLLASTPASLLWLRAQELPRAAGAGQALTLGAPLAPRPMGPVLSRVSGRSGTSGKAPPPGCLSDESSTNMPGSAPWGGPGKGPGPMPLKWPL
jgi:hypothetical protein